MPNKPHAVQHIKTLSFENEVWVGFGFKGECLVAARNENSLGHLRESLTFYKLTQAPTTFQHLWRKPLPPGFGIKCSKFVTKSGNILLHDNSVTIMYNQLLQKLKKLGGATNNKPNLDNRVGAIHNDAWYLCDSLDGIVSVKDLHNGDLLHTIRLQRGHREDFRSIVCCNPVTGFAAVVCAEMNLTGDIQHGR